MKSHKNENRRRKLCLLLPFCMLAAFSGCGAQQASSGGDLFFTASSHGSAAQSSASLSSLPPQSPAASSEEAAPSSQPPTDSPGTPAPFASYLPTATAMVDTFSLEEKVGQLFLPRFPESGAAEQITNCHPAGFILFARDFEGKDAGQVRAMLDACRERSSSPLIFGVDEEGGTVTRISRYPALAKQKFPSPQQVFRAGGMQGIVDDAREKSSLLLSLGIALNFAPVADVSTNPGDFIYDRSFGKDAAATAAYIKTAVQAAVQSGVSPVLKHFPGYGDNEDTHTGIACDKRPYSAFTESDFLPFAAGIEAGAPCVLVSHNIVECMDAARPASLSPEVHRVLREELGFQGIIITDDLAMDAIADFSGSTDAAVLAVKAGNDLLLCSDFVSSYQAVLAAVRDGEIALERVEESAAKVLAWKLWVEAL